MLYLKTTVTKLNNIGIKKIVVNAIGEITIDSDTMDYAIGGIVENGRYRITYCEDLDLLYSLICKGLAVKD